MKVQATNKKMLLKSELRRAGNGQIQATGGTEGKLRPAGEGTAPPHRMLSLGFEIATHQPKVNWDSKGEFMQELGSPRGWRGSESPGTV